MSRARMRVDLRTVLAFIALDLVTSFVVYVLLVPPFRDQIVQLDTTAQQVIEHTLIAVRLTVVGLLTALSLRRRHGLTRRADALPSVGTAAVIMTVLGLAAELFTRGQLGIGLPALLVLVVAVLETLVFPLLGLLLVVPNLEPQDETCPSAALTRR